MAGSVYLACTSQADLRELFSSTLERGCGYVTLQDGCLRVQAFQGGPGGPAQE